MGRKPTARDVAAAAGVSIATVDRVLNNRGSVAPEKERQVLHWARQLGLDRALDLRAARTLRIAIILQWPTNPFHAEIQDRFREANVNSAALNLAFSIFHTPASAIGVTKLITDVGSRYDGLIVTLPRSPRTSDTLRQVAARIPVVTIATDIPDCGRHAYIGPDDLKAGRVAGDLMGRFLRPVGGKVLVIAGLLDMQGQEQRISGFRSVMAERYRECSVVSVVESLEDEDMAGHLAGLALRGDPDIRGIYVASQGAQAVAKALSRSGRSGLVSLVTHELTPGRRRLLQAGLIDAVIDQDPEFEVCVAVQTMARLLGRIDGIPETTVTPIHIHMIENA
jgi:LacI family transcriptional regulator